MLDGLHRQGMFLDITTEGDLAEAMAGAARARQQAAPRARNAARELAIEQKRRELFEQAAFGRTAEAGTESVPVESLFVGDTLPLAGHPMTVSEWLLDAETGQPTAVQLDGPYGRQTVPVGTVVRVDKGASPGLIVGSKAEAWADKVIADGRTRMNAGLDPELLAAYAVKGAALIEQGITSFAQWSEAMLKKQGEKIRPHLESIWRETRFQLARRFAERELPDREGTRQERRNQVRGNSSGGGYIGHSMSVRANNAYAEGKLPASKGAAELGIPTALFRQMFRPSEWHHTSKHFNATDFYDMADVWERVATEPDLSLRIRREVASPAKKQEWWHRAVEARIAAMHQRLDEPSPTSWVRGPEQFANRSSSRAARLRALHEPHNLDYELRRNIEAALADQPLTEANYNAARARIQAASMAEARIKAAQREVEKLFPREYLWSQKGPGGQIVVGDVVTKRFRPLALAVTKALLAEGGEITRARVEALVKANATLAGGVAGTKTSAAESEASVGVTSGLDDSLKNANQSSRQPDAQDVALRTGQEQTESRMVSGPGSQTLPGPQVKPQTPSIEARLDSLKVELRPGDLHAFGLLPQVWNDFIEALKLGIRAGRAAADLIREGVARLKAQHPQFDAEGAQAFLEKAFAGPTRQYGEKILGAPGISPDVQTRVTEYTYAPLKGEDVLATARRILTERGLDGAVQAYLSDRDDMGGAVHSVLGDLITEQLSGEITRAEGSGDTRRRDQLIEQQAAFLDQQLRDSTEWGQQGAFMRRLGLASAGGLARLARRVIQRAGQQQADRQRPAMEAAKQELEAGQQDATTALPQDPRANAAARQAVNTAVEASAETHAAVVVEVGGEWGRSPVIVAEARRQFRELIQGKMRGEGATGPLAQLKARFGVLFDEALNRAVSIANAHYQGVDALPSGNTARTLAEKLRERLGLSKAAAEKLAATLDKEFARLVEAKKKGLSKRIAAQRARQAAGLAGGEVSPIDRAIRQQLRALNLKLGQAVATGGTGADIAARIVAELGLVGPEAEAVARVIEERFNQLATEFKRKRLEALGQQVRSARKVTSAADKLIKAHNLGALTDEALFNLVRERLKLPTWSPEFAAEVNKLANAVPKAPEGFQRQRATLAVLNAVARHKGLRLIDLPMVFWYANVLSGPFTHLKNIVSNLANTVALGAVQTALHPLDTAAYAADLGRGLLKGIPEAAEVLRTGQVTGTRLNKFAAAAPIEQLHRALLPWKLVSRFLAAEDLLFFKSAEEARAGVLARQIGRTEGLRGAALEQRVRDLLARVPERVQAAEVQARSEGLTGRDYTRRVSEILEQSRPPELMAAATDFGLRSTFNQKPEGILGLAANKWTEGIHQVGERFPGLQIPLQLVVPFVNIITNVTNAGLDYTPVGAWRAGRAQLTGNFMGRPVMPLEVQETYAKAVLGTLATAGLAALAAAFLDDEDPPFAIYGAGPRTKDQRDQLKATGWRPYTVKVGDKYVNYQLSPLSIPLAVMGNFFDAARWKNLDETSLAQRVALAWQYVGHVITSQAWLDGLAKVGSQMERDPSGKSAENAVKSWVRSGTAFVIPNVAKQVDQLFDPTVYDDASLTAMLANQVPIVRSQGRPALDVFGQPVLRPATSQFLSQRLEDPLRQTLIARGIWISMPDRDVIIGDKSRGPDHSRALTEDEFYDYVKLSGAAIRDRLDPNRIRDMDPDRAKAHVREVVREERERILKRFR